MSILFSKIYIKIRSFLKKLYRGNYYYFLWLFPINRKKIVVTNYFGKGYGDNGKFIVEEIRRRSIEFDIVWLTNENDEMIPSSVRQVKYKSFKAIYELATAKIWIDNCRKIYFPPKRSKQYYLQTWHGNFPLKKIEMDAEKSLGHDYIYTARLDSDICDYFISNSKFMTNLYQSSFWYKGDIIEFGSPRNDIFFQNSDNNKRMICSKYNIDINSKILLYAPTFRKIKNKDVYLRDFRNIISALESKFGKEWIVFVRLHPNDFELFNLYTSSDKVINASNYSDMQDLLISSDILITDYSSSMFDFILTKKPCFLYMNDYINYKNDRDFYFSLDDIPFPIAFNSKDLIRLIESFDNIIYLERIQRFIDKFDVKDFGQSSDKVVSFILKLCKE